MIDEKRFWSKVRRGDSDQCWEWTGAKTPNGYAVFWNRGATKNAHRIAYCLAKGPIRKGFLIRHLCHNRSCCNPAHLAEGTAADNANDSRAAGRYPAHGIRYKNAKLNDQAVREIRKVVVDFNSALAMMAKYRVSATTIQSIVARKSWKHVI
jgi:hypothetical protein